MSRKYIQTISDIQRVYNQGKTISFSGMEEATFRRATQMHSGEMPKGVDITVFSLSDKGEQAEEALSQLQEEWWMSKLTRKQRKVIELMKAERKRRKVAEMAGVSLQAVNQIIIRIRRRIEMWEAMA